MSEFSGTLTALGRELQAKAQTGVELKYTKFMVGDGKLGSQSIPTLTNLIHPLYTFDINRLEMTPPDRALVGFVINPTDITEGFYLREIGLFANDPDRGEILYWYGNAGDTADYQPPGDGSSNLVEKNFNLYVFVGSATKVTAVINQSLVYATPQDVAAALEKAKEYTDEQIANVKVPDASLTKKGIVQLSSATNSTAEDRAATPKAVKAAYDLANSGMVPRSAAGVKDFNNLTTPGMYTIGEASELANNPGAAGWGLLVVEATSQPYIVQRFFAIGNGGGRIFMRARSEGAASWTAWKEVFTTSGGTINGSVNIIGNGNGNLHLIGIDHVYMEFYPQGLAGGRKYYIGSPSAGNENLELCVTNPDGQIVFYDPLAGGMTLNDIKVGINQAKQAGVDYKNKIAGAINSKGGNASATMTSDQMAAAITALTSRTADVSDSYNSDSATQVNTLYSKTFFSFPAITKRISFMANNATGTNINLQGSGSGSIYLAIRLYDDANNYVDLVSYTSGIDSTRYLYGFVYDAASRTVKVNGSVPGTFSLPSGFNVNGPLSVRGVFSFPNLNLKGTITVSINGTLNYL